MSDASTAEINGKEPQTFHQTFSRFVDDDNDIVGLLALSYFISTHPTLINHPPFNSDFARLTDGQIHLFREAADIRLTKKTERAISSAVDKIKLDASSSSVSEMMKSHIDYISEVQVNNFDRVMNEVQRSGSTARQILIAVISSFVFGVIISAAAFVANPFLEVIQAVKVPAQAEKGR